MSDDPPRAEEAEAVVEAPAPTFGGMTFPTRHPPGILLPPAPAMPLAPLTFDGAVRPDPPGAMRRRRATDYAATTTPVRALAQCRLGRSVSASMTVLTNIPL